MADQLESGGKTLLEMAQNMAEVGGDATVPDVSVPEPKQDAETTSTEAPEETVQSEIPTVDIGEKDDDYESFFQKLGGARTSAQEQEAGPTDQQIAEYIQGVYAENPLKGIDALVQIKVQQALGDFYKNRIQPLEDETVTIAEERAYNLLSRKYGKVSQHADGMKQFLEENPYLKELPPDKYLEYAFLVARDKSIPSALKKAQEIGKAEALRSIGEAKHPGLAQAGRSPGRIQPAQTTTLNDDQKKIQKAMKITEVQYIEHMRKAGQI